jgi:uncharacterized integral membrane protein
LNNLWQRFLLASSLIVGVLIGVATTVFGYSNLSTVDVHWSVFHIDGIPLWTVAIVPLALFVIAGTLYHWMDGLHHFTEHMRHRRRVHELEAEVASLRAHLDQVLEMPGQSTSRLPQRKASTVSLPAAEEEAPEPAPEPEAPEPVKVEEPDIQASRRSRSSNRKRATLEVGGDAQRPDHSGSHVEGMSGDGQATEPAHALVDQEA